MQMLHLSGGNTSPRHGIVPTRRFRFTLLSRGAPTHVTRGSLGCIRRARRRRGSSSKNGERSSRRQSALGVQPRGATRGGCRVSSPEPAFRPRREPRLASSAPTRRGRLLGVVADGPVGTAVRPVARRQRLLGIVVGIAASHLLSTLHDSPRKPPTPRLRTGYSSKSRASLDPSDPVRRLVHARFLLSDDRPRSDRRRQAVWRLCRTTPRRVRCGL